MGRSLSGAFGASNAAAGGAQALTTAFIAGEAMAQGQVVTLGGDNLAYYAVDPNSSASPAAWRPLNQVATAYGVAQGAPLLNATNIASATGGYNFNQKTMCQLSNGNTAIINQNNIDSTLRIAIFSATSGQSVLPLTTVETAANYYYTIAPLNGGGFAISYYSTATGFLTVKTYDNNGSLTGSFTTTLATTTIQPNLTPLSNGSFVLSYFAANATTWVGIFSNVCAVVLAIFQVNATATNQFNAVVAALAGGGFVVYFATTNGTTNGPTAFIIYSNTGAVVKAQTNMVSAVGPQYMNAIGLVGGGFVLCTSQTVSTSAGFALAVYNAAGIQQGATYTDAASVNANASLAAATDGSLFVMYQAASTLVVKFSAAGAKIGSALTLSYTGTSGGGSQPWLLAASPDGGAMAFLYNSAAVSVAYISPAVLQSIAPFVITIANSLFHVDAFVYQPTSCPNPCFALMTFSNGNTAALNLYALKVQKQVAIGVSIASATAQNAVPIQFTGNFTLAATWVQPYAMNFQSNSPAGQRMNIVGNIATLYGMQPPDGRRQIN